MRFPRHFTLAALLTAFSCKQREALPSRGDQPSLIGTWRALEFINPRRTDSSQRWPLGRPPRAYLVYDATGHIFFQTVSGLATNPAARGYWSNADSAALRALLASASAYFGTYRVNAGTGTVTHHIEGEIPPNPGNTEVATPFSLRLDTLVLGRDSSAHWTFLRVRP